MSEVENGYRVVWGVGFWLDYTSADEALDLYCALEPLPAFEDELLRPRIVPIRGGELTLGPMAHGEPDRH